MKQITLTSMVIDNFKGIQHLELKFDHRTNICGANRTGKTSIGDAYTWLITGKAMDGRDGDSINIETRNTNGQLASPKARHSVSATLMIDGHKATLKREKEEKWSTPRGEAEERYTASTTNYWINDVSKTEAEYNQYIQEICDARTLTLISNPMAFCRLPQAEQREELLKVANIAGWHDVTSDERFADLLHRLDAGESINDILDSLRAAIKRCQGQIHDDTIRYDEQQRGIFADPHGEEHWRNILSDTKANIDSIRAQRTSITAASDAQRKRIETLNKELTDLTNEKARIEREITNDTMQEYTAAVQADCNRKSKLTQAEGQLTNYRARHLNETKSRDIDKADFNRLSADFDRELAKQPEIKEGDLVCKACGRPFEQDRADLKIQEITYDFNKLKSKTLDDINTRLNILKMQIERKDGNIKELEELIKGASQAIDTIKADIAANPLPVEPQVDYTNYNAWHDACHAIQAKEAEIKMASATVDDSEAKAGLEQQLSLLKPILDEAEDYCKRYDNNQAIEKRKAEIEACLQANRGLLAIYQQDEELAQELSNLRTTIVEDRVNKLFDTVRFTMFVYTKKDGKAKEKCQATVNGVPFADVNRADQINAGLDICAALSNYYQISAPIIIDNAEAVNSIKDVPAQCITLTVTEDKVLTIK